MDAGTLTFLIATFALPQAEPASASTPADEPAWTFDLSAYTVNPPEDDAYSSATLRLDRDALHLEARWNYEDLHTGSLFAGWNIEWPARDEDGLGLTVTPMVGLVSGDTDGLAPGVLIDVTWWWLEFWNESEYLLDAHDHDDDYFYSWSELTIAPDWLDRVGLRFGVVGQRTNAYDTDLSLDRGVLLGLSFERLSGTIYWFNPEQHDSYVMFSLGFGF